MKIEFASGKDFGDGDTLDQDFLESMARKYSDPRPDIHVSDLTVCPRETVFRKREPKPFTVRDLLNFSSGEAIHNSLEGLVTEYPEKYERFDEGDEVRDGYTKEKANRIWYKDLIVCTPDLMNKEKEIVYELKSTKDFKLDEPKVFHLRQLAAYMSIWDKEVGYIKYMLLDPWKVKQTQIAARKRGEKLKAEYDPMTNPFPKWRLTMDKEDRENMLKWLESEALSLKTAILENNPEKARHIAYDEEFISPLKGNWKCNGCKYKKECEEMRARERTEIFNK